MRLTRLIARKERGDIVVYADISGQGKKAARTKLGYLSDRDSIEQQIEAIRAAPTLRDALLVRGGM